MTPYRSILLATAALASPALAQETPDDIVVTAAGAPQAASEAGDAITVVTRADLETRQTVSIADYLATTPGVSMTRSGGPGTLTSLSIRGAEATQTLVLIDGVRVNDPSSPGGAFDFGSLLSGSVERVEVLRGVNSVPWGSQAIGGVVNIVTEQPPEAGIAARASAEYGAADSVYANGAVSGRSGALSGALTGGYLRSDGISAASSGTERDGYRQIGGSARLGVDITKGVGLDLRGYYAHSTIDLDGFPPPAYSFADTPEYSTTQEIYGYAGVYATVGRWRNRAAFTIADVNRDNYDPSFSTAPGFIGRGRSERYEYQGDYRIVDQLRVIAGAEHENSRFDDGSTTASAGVTSVYGELIVQPVRQLTITGGVRNDDHDDYGTHTSFGANAALALDTGTTLRASYAEGFKAPTLYQLHGAYGTATLAPETAKSYDVGIEQAALGGRVRVGATYFHRATHNQIDFDLGTYTYANIARARAEGVELGVTLRPVDAFTVAANYTYTRTENRTPGTNLGNDLARRPRETVNFSADYRFPDALSLGGTVSVVGDSYDDAGNVNRLDGYVLAGVRAELPVGGRFTLYGRIDNLFDARYQTVSGYGTFGRAAYGGIRMKLD
ncbi:TonB-dependent receptor plug domain-containing protein [Hephaestia sp. GCM10023244]|uniref:TonB-dependent receptor plug domain-containing protein n=1 Tax=unclassified Hephaestia TaxID=2631281 RepID=UPI0020773B16|nr:TonB-dependent receptor [Hephaestia sp. MAHUQ-44]MCM8730626.1 TonB-dependent receptor [Hephaestia sp. MAHUQ-44]